jgi:mannobiose 2-epimerase
LAVRAQSHYSFPRVPTRPPAKEAAATDRSAADRGRLARLARQAKAELRERILPFWLRLRDEQRGGFFGAATSRGRPLPSAAKGAVLHGRILWTFSAAHARWPDPVLLGRADAAFLFIADHLVDHEHGGVFWTATAEGEPADTSKHLYAQAFAIYGLAAYHAAAGAPGAKALALELFEAIERKAADAAHGGWFEAFERDWTPVPNALMQRPEAARTFNAHFHLLEALDALLAVAPDDVRLRRRTESLLALMIGPALDRRRKTFRQFFDAEWLPLDEGGSNGHDIEASWLLPAIAGRLGASAADATDAAIADVAEGVLARGVGGDGGVAAGRDVAGALDRGKLWWVQAEALVGFLEAYERSGDPRFLDAVERLWAFIQDSVVDPAVGEWRERIDPPGVGRAGPWPKAHLWKCPYHNGRACLEVSARAARLAGAHR